MLIGRINRYKVDPALTRLRAILLAIVVQCCPRAWVQTFGLAVECWTDVWEVVGLRLGRVTTLRSAGLSLPLVHSSTNNISGRTQVLYKAHVLYCALFSQSCFFPVDIAKSAFLCFIFVSCLSGWNFYLKFLFKTLK